MCFWLVAGCGELIGAMCSCPNMTKVLLRCYYTTDTLVYLGRQHTLLSCNDSPRLPVMTTLGNLSGAYPAEIETSTSVGAFYTSHRTDRVMRLH